MMDAVKKIVVLLQGSYKSRDARHAFVRLSE